jgi:hypothetical protein
MLEFKCNCCGACCKFVGHIVQQVRAHKARGLALPEPYRRFDTFPYKFLENGTCTMLDEDNRCKVYDERPEVCNVQFMFDTYYNFMGKEQYLKASADACKLLRMTAKRIEDHAASIVYSDMQPSGEEREIKPSHETPGKPD